MSHWAYDMIKYFQNLAIQHHRQERPSSGIVTTEKDQQNLVLVRNQEIFRPPIQECRGYLCQITTGRKLSTCQPQTTETNLNLT